MASVVEIYNMALNRMGESQRVEATEEDSTAGRACDLWYPQIRDALLTEAPWPFATKTESLEQLANFTPLRREYGYTLPTDMLVLREIWTGSIVNRPEDRERFEYEQHDGLTVLVTDADEVDIVYTQAITDPEQFPPLFVNALVWGLAAELSIALDKAGSEERLRARYDYERQKAVAWVLNEIPLEPDPVSKYISVRG